MEVLGVIGARSGSRGVADKNIRPLAGKPLIAWIIETAIESRAITRTVVSTDSQKYASLAAQFGAEVPFLRPKELATDASPEKDYLVHALKWLREREGYFPGIVVRLQPTNPLQLPEDVDRCVEKLIADSRADSAMVVAECRQHPRKALKMVSDADGGDFLVDYFTGETAPAAPNNRQSHARAYFRANLVATRTDVLLNSDSQVGDRILAHVIPQERAIDIDTPLDFLVAEQLLRMYRIQKMQPAGSTSR